MSTSDVLIRNILSASKAIWPQLLVGVPTSKRGSPSDLPKRKTFDIGVTPSTAKGVWEPKIGVTSAYLIHAAPWVCEFFTSASSVVLARMVTHSQSTSAFVKTTPSAIYSKSTSKHFCQKQLGSLETSQLAQGRFIASRLSSCPVQSAKCTVARTVRLSSCSVAQPACSVSCNSPSPGPLLFCIFACPVGHIGTSHTRQPNTVQLNFNDIRRLSDKHAMTTLLARMPDTHPSQGHHTPVHHAYNSGNAVPQVAGSNMLTGSCPEGTTSFCGRWAYWLCCTRRSWASLQSGFFKTNP